MLTCRLANCELTEVKNLKSLTELKSQKKEMKYIYLYVLILLVEEGGERERRKKLSGGWTTDFIVVEEGNDVSRRV